MASEARAGSDRSALGSDPDQRVEIMIRRFAALKAYLCLIVGLAFGVGCVSSQSIQVPMRDGVELQTVVYLPGEGKYPTVLTRGYSAEGLAAYAPEFLAAGYAFVGQETRGGGGKDGSRFFPDDLDGYDTVEWIAAQEWSDGNVAMWGGSYYGATQWRAAVARPPSLKAIIPGHINAEPWKDQYRSFGAIRLKMTTQGRAIEGQPSIDQLMHLPLITLDDKYSGDNPLWNAYIKHSSWNSYWKPIGMRDGNKYDRIDIPVYIFGGWKDQYSGAAFESYQALQGKNPQTRVSIYDVEHTGAPRVAESIAWLDEVLKGEDRGFRRRAPITLEVRGGETLHAEQWPVENTRFERLYLSSRSGERIGSLVGRQPLNEPPTVFSYDPKDPAPAISANGSHFSVPGVLEVGPKDQVVNESRSDVLVFSSPELSEEVLVAGPIEMRLFAASSAFDTDFTVKLLDVAPDGSAVNITEGIVRARFRESIFDKPKKIVPGKVYEFRIELLPMAIVFKRGHKIRVHISSSSFPLWDRNLNTGNPIGMDDEMTVAEQTVYHDTRYPSHLILPILKGDIFSTP